MAPREKGIGVRAILLLISLGAFLLLTFQNCKQIKDVSNPPSNKNGKLKSVTTELGALVGAGFIRLGSDYYSGEGFGYFQDELEIQYENGRYRLVGPLCGGENSAFELSESLSEEILDFVSQSPNVCETKYIIPDGVDVCLALPTPTAWVETNTNEYPLHGSVCLSTKIHFCEESDSERYQNIYLDIKSELEEHCS